MNVHYDYPTYCNYEPEQLHECDYSGDNYKESEMFYYADHNVWVAKRFKNEWIYWMRHNMPDEDYELLTKKIEL